MLKQGGKHGLFDHLELWIFSDPGQHSAQVYSDGFDHFNGRLVAAEAVLAVGKSAKSADCTLLTLQ